MPSVLINFEAEELLKTCVEPRVTEESIKGKIILVDYLYHSTTTICVITMANGFKFIGTSTPAASGNYRMELGQKYAYDNAFKQIWTHEGYLLRENLSQEERPANV